MRTIITITIALALFAFSKTPNRISLQDAINKKLVKVKIRSLGRYQGESVQMDLQNLSGHDLQIEIEPGRKLVADEDKYQNLLVVKQAEILVKANSKASKNIVGYCCESSDSGPRKELGYKTSALADSNLVKLARYINANYMQLNANSIQQSVWALSNNHPSAAIGASTETEMSLKNLVCGLKNEPIPWYVIRQKIHQTPDGRIHLVNDSLLGKMAYTNSGWCYSKLNVYDTQNNAVLISIASWLQPGSNTIYNVALPIKQLAKGKYKLTLENDAQIFTQKEIQI